jgi:hypothetical protein
MFPFPIAKPQGCDIQTFYGAPTTIAAQNDKTWNKPVGVSHVYMLLIGGGSDGDGTNGGGSSSVTVWYGAAQHVPNSLLIRVAGSSASSSVLYRGTSLTTLISATGSGGAPTAGAAVAANQFSAMGFYQSIAGQNGSSSDIFPASSTTFLCGGTGSGASNTTIAGNYGYGLSSATTNNNGIFLMQPIIVGLGGKAGGTGGIGCGGGHNGKGGQGMVLIASW